MALAADPVSAYGGVVAVNRPVDRRARRTLAEQFVEVLLAPAPTRRARRSAPAGARAGRRPERRAFVTDRARPRRVLGGLLVQDRDADGDPLETMDVVCGELRESASGRSCSSPGGRQARRLERDRARAGGQTIGVGAGQMSRVDAVRIALDKARELGHELDGRGARLRRVLPFRRRPAARARGGHPRGHPARRLEARRRGDRAVQRRRRGDGLHGAPALPALTLVRRRDSAGAGISAARSLAFAEGTS